MKKILLYISLLSICLIAPVFGDVDTNGPSDAIGPSSEKNSITVKVSEDFSALGLNCGNEKDGYYECEVEKGFNSIQIMIGNAIQYATFLIGLVGVLFIVINGIAYSIGGGEKTEIKDRITKSAMGLLLLLLSGVFLNSIAPWVYSV